MRMAISSITTSPPRRCSAFASTRPGEIPASEVADKFVTTDLDGSPLATEHLPLVIALTRAEPAHRPLRFKAGDGSWRVVEVTALPVTGHADRPLGAVTMFWEPPL